MTLAGADKIYHYQ